MTALGIVCCYIMGRSLAWNWLSLVSCVFLVLFTFGLYYIPESPPWLVYNEEEDLAFKSMAMIRLFLFSSDLKCKNTLCMKNSLAGLDWVNFPSPFQKIYLPLFFGSDKNFFHASDILELQGGRV